MSDILSKILEQKKVEVAHLEVSSLQKAAWQSPLPRDFLAAVKSQGTGKPIRLIAELKRASPSKGVLAAHLDLLKIADIYTKNGAAAISVLTDEKFFQGKLETINQLRSANGISLPLLRKDFIIDESQIFESRANSADAILLIAAAIPDTVQLADLHACAQDLNLTVLMEVHDEHEVERVLRIDGIMLIGINNRNLATFEVSLETTERLRSMIPPQLTIVSESGILSSNDVRRMANAHLDAILVGEALITSPDLPAKVRELAGEVTP
jgi:indole-3-glycerol phosphate synthase